MLTPKWTAFLLSVLILVIGVCPVSAEHYPVYFLGGQSNANGRGDASAFLFVYLFKLHLGWITFNSPLGRKEETKERSSIFQMNAVWRICLKK